MKAQTKIIIGTAIAGLMQMGAAGLSAAPASANTLIECNGVNSCKGTGACGGKTHSCAGKNSCKGHGFLKMTQADCDAAKAAKEGATKKVDPK